ncbi:DUF2490 domain-containing protein [Terrimonas alba]|uniref:DUF2490 domain-containing protein n=1 Tax=Terrimonas alba TaxID=3349636 RepID=UPI0035F36CA2
MQKLVLCFLLVYISCSFCGLNAQTQFSGWLASFNTFKTGKRTSIHADVQWRSSNEWKHTQTLLLRSGLNVHLNKHFTVTGGYAFIHNRRVLGDISGYTPEHRLWEQLLYNHKVKTLSISHRLRFEQRFMAKTIIADEELKKDGSLYANRIRYFIRNVIPFQQQKAFSKGLFAALQNEVFVNIGNKANVNGKYFDQNRLYVALGCRVNPAFDLETGYLNQYINGRNNSFTNNHVWQLAGYLRL